MTNEITTNLHRSMLPIVNRMAMNRRERKNRVTCNLSIAITDNTAPRGRLGGNG